MKNKNDNHIEPCQLFITFDGENIKSEVNGDPTDVSLVLAEIMIGEKSGTFAAVIMTAMMAYLEEVGKKKEAAILERIILKQAFDLSVN